MLINGKISHGTGISPHIFTGFFFMRTFIICCLSKLQLYSTVLWTRVTMLYYRSSGLFMLALKVSILLLSSPYYPKPSARETTTLFSIPMSLLFFLLKSLHINDVMHRLSCPVWLISLSIMPSESIQVVINSRISFFLTAE